MPSRNGAPREVSLSSPQVRPSNAQSLPAITPRSQRTQESSSRIGTQSAPNAFSKLRTLSLAPKLQPSPFHAFPHSFTTSRNITPAFSSTSALFARSFTKVQVSTPLFSCAPALFVKNTREGVHLPPKNFERKSQTYFEANPTASGRRACCDGRVYTRHGKRKRAYQRAIRKQSPRSVSAAGRLT